MTETFVFALFSEGGASDAREFCSAYRRRSGAGYPFTRTLTTQITTLPLETTNRYAEITVRMKEAAMKLCEPPTAGHTPRTPAWRDDAALLTWLASL